MPYLEESRKEFILNNPAKPHNEGDMNYLFTLAIIRVWEQTPRYKTIHNLRKACYHEPQSIAHIYTIECRLLALNVDRLDIKIARELAFNEFMRRIGSVYEEEKRVANGDVYPEKYITVDVAILKKKGRK